MSDTEYQLNNWMHFIWLSGDQIAEQAVHNIDAMNWVMGSPPVTAYGPSFVTVKLRPSSL